MTAFPGAEASFTGFTSSHTLAQDTHASQHNLEQSEIVATQHKIGTGSSTPTSGLLLRGTGAGTSSWAQANLTSDVTGVLPTANGGSGTTLLTFPSGSDTLVARNTTDTLTNKTLTTPTIGDFTNANHNHQNTAGGGTLNATNALQNSTVTADKLSTGAATSEVATNESTASLTYTNLTTVQAVTVTVGANGLLLVGYGAQTVNSLAQYFAPALTGANTSVASDSDAGQASTNISIARIKLYTGLTPGSTTVTLKFRVDSGTGNWLRRNIWALPL